VGQKESLLLHPEKRSSKEEQREGWRLARRNDKYRGPPGNPEDKNEVRSQGRENTRLDKGPLVVALLGETRGKLK